MRVFVPRFVEVAVLVVRMVDATAEQVHRRKRMERNIEFDEQTKNPPPKEA